MRIENADWKSKFSGDYSYRLGQIRIVGDEHSDLKAIQIGISEQMCCEVYI